MTGADGVFLWLGAAFGLPRGEQRTYNLRRAASCRARVLRAAKVGHDSTLRVLTPHMHPGARVHSPRQWMLKRNCALSPRQLALIYASLVAVSTLIGVGFAWMGAWLVLPFAGIEMLVLGVALLKYGRHASDRECIVLDHDALDIEVVRAGRASRARFNPYWVRVETRGRNGRDVDCVWLGEGARRVAVGQYVGAQQRLAFVRELQSALAAWQSGGSQAVRQFGSSTR